MEAAFAGNLNERLWDHMSDFLFDEVSPFLIHFVWLLVLCSLVIAPRFCGQPNRVNVLVYL